MAEVWSEQPSLPDSGEAWSERPDQGNVLWPMAPGTTGEIIPLRRDPQGALHAAWPGFIHGMVNSTYNALTGPGEVLTGRTPTGASAHPDPLQISQDIAGTGLGFGAATPGIQGGFSSFKGWHGTPHEFEPVEHNPFGEFRDDKIGSGEGAQVYGYGHYVAGRKGTAEDYQKNLTNSEPTVTFNGAPIDPHDNYSRHFGDEVPDFHIQQAMGEINSIANITKTLTALKQKVNSVEEDFPDTTQLRRDMIKSRRQLAYDWFKSNQDKFDVIPGKTGNLLHLEITPEEHELLDWDQRLDSHPQSVFNKIDSLAGEEAMSNWTGEDLYNHLVSKHEVPNMSDMDSAPRAASKALSAAGIPGIKYADWGSRDLNPEHGGVEFNGKNITGPNKYPSNEWEKMLPAIGNPADTDAAIEAFRHLHDENSVYDTVNKLNKDIGFLKAHMDTYIAPFPENPYHKGDMEDYSGRIKSLSDPLNWIEKNKDKISYASPKEGTYNYVIFDPKHIRIIGKNGQRLKMESVEHDPFAEDSQ